MSANANTVKERSAELIETGKTIATNTELLKKLRESPSKYTVTDPETGQTRRLVGRDIENLQRQTDQLRMGFDVGLVNLNTLAAAEKASRDIKTQRTPSATMVTGIRAGERTTSPDVEPAIDTSHLDSLEIEQKRQVLARSDPSVAQLPSESTLRSQARGELTAQAGEIESTIAAQDIIFNENMRLANKTLEVIEDAPPGQKIITVETDEGPQELTKSEYQGFVSDYVDRYNDWRESATGTVADLGAARASAFEQVGRYARNIAERTSAINTQKADFNQELTNLTGGATIGADEPGLTKFEERFGVAGIPGPGAGPAPGSFGEKLKQEFGDPAARKVKQTLDVLESPFVSATTQVRTRAERLQSEASEAPSFAGLGKFLEGAALVTGAAAFDAVTFGIRPGLVVKSAVSFGKLVTDPETQKAVVEKAVKDPFTFTAEIAGTLAGANLGAKLSDIGGTLFRERGPIFRAARAEFKVSGIRGVPRTIRAVAGRGTARLDFSQLLKEEIALYEFPSEVIHAEPFEIFTKFKVKEIKPEFRRVVDPFDFAIDTLPGEFTRFGRGGTLVRTGEGIMEIPISVPESMTVPTSLLRKTVFSLVQPTGRPAIPISIPQLGISLTRGLSFAGVLAAFSIPKSREIQRLKPTGIQRPGTVQQNFQRFNQELSIKTRNLYAPPKGISAIIQVPTQARIQVQPQIQPQVQRPLTISIPRISVAQIQIPQIPEIDEPKPPDPTTAFVFTPPPRAKTTRTVLDYDPRKKKKKDRKKRGVKKIVEKRKTPLGVINWDPRKQT